MEDHTTTDSTLAILRTLRVDYPWVGAVLQAYLRRTAADCQDLATPQPTTLRHTRVSRR
jgi:proline dehydrogenase